MNTFLTGDCLYRMQSLPPHSFDCIFADPPYNLQLKGALQRPDESDVDAVTDQWDQFASLSHYDEFTRGWLAEAKRLLKPNGSLWVIGSYHNIFRIGAMLQDMGFWILNDIIWDKANPMPNFRGRRFTNAHETLIWAAPSEKAKHTFNYRAMKALNEDKQMRSTWQLPICSGKERLKDEHGKKAHSTQKPESLLGRVILSSTNPGDSVLDLFGGTGTTSAVCKKLGRKATYIDQDPEYANIAGARVAATTPLPPGALSVIPEKRSTPRIPFGYFVETGAIPAGTVLRTKKGAEATVTLDGSLAYSGPESPDPVTNSIHRIGAMVEHKQTCNGWTLWYMETESGEVLIDTIRQREIIRRKAP